MIDFEGRENAVAGLGLHAAALGDWVPGFVRASNIRSGIIREPTAVELAAHRGLLACNDLRVRNLELFVGHIQRGALLRKLVESAGQGGGPTDAAAELRSDLSTILLAARTRSASADRLHRVYNLLRPFTDANARSGRALWMWRAMRGTREEFAALRLGPVDSEPFWSPDQPGHPTLM